MDLLGGYGSDGSGDEEKETVLSAPAATSAPSPASRPPAPAAALAGHAAGAAAAAQQEDEEQPVPAFSRLPTPKAPASKRVVAFQLPLTKHMLQAPDSDEEAADAERRAKRLRASNKTKSKLMDYLPPPKNADAQALGAGLGAGLGGGGGGGGGGGRGRHGFFGAGDDDDDEDPVLAAGRGDGSAAAAGLTAASLNGNEAYRAADEDEGDGGGDGAGPSSGVAWQHHAAAAAPMQGPSSRGYQHGAGPSSAPGPSRQQQKQQQQQQGGLELPDELANVQFKEIDQKQLRYVDPAKKEAANSIRSALGAEFAVQMRSQAAGHSGTKLARSKHQIGTLYFNAKMNEIDLLEGKAQSMKTKSETQAKYGW